MFDPKTKTWGPRYPKEWKAADYSQQKIADYKPFNFVDGDGVRCSIYVSSCLFNCKGCYNKKVQDFSYGVPYTDELEEKILNDLSQPYVQGLTLLGGEPFMNTQVLNRLVRKVRERFGHTKDIWSWSGYYYEELLQETDDKLWLLHHIDVLVDGRFILDKLNLNLRFRGSSNQRIIDVPKSLETGKLVLWMDGKYDDF